jgi:hypothetical protein
LLNAIVLREYRLAFNTYLIEKLFHRDFVDI